VVLQDGQLVLTNENTEDVRYKFGLSEWATARFSTEYDGTKTGISALPQHHPMGCTVEIRFTDPHPERFDSLPFRVRIPRPGRAPKLPRVRESRRGEGALSGFSNRMEWSADPESGIWVEITKEQRTIPYNSENLQREFPGLTDRDSSGHVHLYLRTKETPNGRTGASAPVVFKIPAQIYGQ
jgi:hypothetical protein